MSAAARRAALTAAVRVQHTGARAIRGRRPAVRRRLPLQLEPTAITRSFFAALRVVLGRARQLVDEDLVHQLPELARRAAGGENVHDLVVAKVDAAAAAFAREYSLPRLQQLVAQFGQRTSEFQRLQLMRQLKAGLGAEPPLRDAAAHARVQAFATESATKLRALVATYFADVQARTLRALRPRARTDAMGEEDDTWLPPPHDTESSTGTGGGDVLYELRGEVTLDEFTLELGRRSDVAMGRAAQLADLDTRSLFGDLNEQRQRELGLEAYRWRTMGDDRVRPEHAALDGSLQRWDAPPAPGNPGDDYNCRCIAEPDLGDLQGAL